MLPPGVTIPLTASGRSGSIVRYIGEGSQGTVYELALPDTLPHALKWYFRHTGSHQQRIAIASLVERGAPSPHFLWPSELVDLPGDPSFGYLMPLRPPGFAALSDLLTRRVDVPHSVVCTLGLELANDFFQLHSQGLCYRDISFANVFFEPATGEPLIVDNDNVGIDGVSPSAVLGTKTFMAPEIVRGEAGPSTNTDLYSLAVLLFYLLMTGHPLLGRRELERSGDDEADETLLFGRQPVFVFDPVDDSNRPVAEEHGDIAGAWWSYPQFLRDVFIKSFTQGLSPRRGARVGESTWRATLSRLRDAIQLCPSCARENFYDADRPDAACWSCGAALGKPLRLVFDRETLVLNRDTRVASHHIARDYDFTHTVARVAQHPGDPRKWGLLNTTARPWRATIPGRAAVEIEPNRSVSLVPGTTLDFGRAVARLEQ